MRPSAFAFPLILAIYALLLIATLLTMPLRLGEILQAAAALHFSWDSFFAWIARTPGAVPLNYLAQLPFALQDQHSRVFLRVPSLLFALGSCWVFFVLAKRVPLQRPYLALITFLAVPVHLRYATQARPFEQGLFFLLLATLYFIHLVDSPTVPRAITYGLILSLAIYSEPPSFLPAAGYALFLLGFANLAPQRRALWFALPATVIPALAYVPFYLWASPQNQDPWLNESFPGLSIPVIALQALMSANPEQKTALVGVVFLLLLSVGLIAGLWSTFPLGQTLEGAPPPTPAIVRKRTILFCLGGGSLVATVAAVSIDTLSNSQFAPQEILWALPGFVILSFAALDWLVKQPVMQALPVIGPSSAILLIALCVPGDWEYLSAPPPDIADLTALVEPQLTGDSCVVFVSERLSPYIFEVFQPQLANRECLNFFHRRVVLAVHPFVRPDQQEDAESFFKGLDFAETARQHAGGGEIITLEQKK